VSRPNGRTVSLRDRMLLASIALAAIVVGVFVATILAVSAARTATKQEARSKNLSVQALRYEKLVLDIENGVRGYALSGDKRFLGPYHRAKSALPAQKRLFASLASDQPVQAARARTLEGLIGIYVETFADPVANFSNRGAAELAFDSVGRTQAATIHRRFAQFINKENDLSDERERAADSKSQHAIELGVVGLTGSAILILLFAIYLARGIARPVREAAAGAGQVAGGDLSIRLSQTGPGEVGELTTSFNEMAARLEATHSELEEQNAQLRESERLKSDLVNTVSHELRTPLSGVLGFTKLLLTRDFDPETRRHYLGIVDAQARRLSDLLDDFLDVRRIEEGRFERAKELVDMATLLEEEAQLYRQQSPKHEVAVEIDHPPLAVMGNPDRLRQVIGNLISNAIKYSPQGGVVAVTADRENGHVRVEVRDQGMGIPLGQQSQIFTKFFRGDAPASGITGTGLGLAVSRDIVESHGGRIGFTSAEGKGTTFFVELPGVNGVKDRQGHDDDQS
jgi:signal transduction histidine kinase